mgnify:CR=1 FL=1
MPHKSDVQVALISGGTSGIGFATAKLLLKEGWCVVINGRDEKSGQKAKMKLRRYSSRVQYIKGDVSKIAEELADVEIVTMQCKYMFDIASKVKGHKAGKLFRLESRIDNFKSNSGEYSEKTYKEIKNV